MEKKFILNKLKAIKNKIEIERLVLPSLQNMELTEENINKYVDVMNGAYETNITMLVECINSLENKSSEKDGK